MVRKLSAEERSTALDLAWEVFSRYESQDYSPEGTEEFRKCLQDEEYLAGIAYYGAFDGEELIGLVEIELNEFQVQMVMDNFMKYKINEDMISGIYLSEVKNNENVM